jgi:hypothetical protein
MPIGAMSTGSGGIGNESVETLLKDLRRRFSGLEPAYAGWRLDPESYTIEQVAKRLRSFLFEEKAAACPDPTSLQLRLCGYSAGRPLTEVWEVNMAAHTCPPPRQIMDENSFGVLWDGQYEALNRLILGLGFDIGDALVRHGVPPQSAGELQSNLAKDLYATLAVPAMPIRDAIDLARFLVETTIGFVRFAVFLPKSVGGGGGNCRYYETRGLSLDTEEGRVSRGTHSGRLTVVGPVSQSGNSTIKKTLVGNAERKR